LGRQAIVVALVALAAYIVYRQWRRAALMKTLERARITVDDLYRLMGMDSPPIIFDIRSAEKRTLDPFIIAG